MAHSSRPLAAVVALTSTAPGSFAKSCGRELAAPGSISAAGFVPSGVPSVIHGSMPCSSSCPAK
jgi:hypothetical protein